MRCNLSILLSLPHSCVCTKHTQPRYPHYQIIFVNRIKQTHYDGFSIIKVNCSFTNFTDKGKHFSLYPLFHNHILSIVFLWQIQKWPTHILIFHKQTCNKTLAWTPSPLLSPFALLMKQYYFLWWILSNVKSSVNIYLFIFTFLLYSQGVPYFSLLSNEKNISKGNLTIISKLIFCKSKTKLEITRLKKSIVAVSGVRFAYFPIQCFPRVSISFHVILASR